MVLSTALSGFGTYLLLRYLLRRRAWRLGGGLSPAA